MADRVGDEAQSSLQLLIIDAAVAFDAPDQTAQLLDTAQQVWTAQALCVTLAATTAVLEEKLARTSLAGKFDRLSGCDDELLQGYACVADAIQELAIDWESTGVLAVSTDLLSLQHLRKNTEMNRPSCHTHWASPASVGVQRLISALRGERTAEAFKDGPPEATVPPVLVTTYFEFHPWGPCEEDNPRSHLATLPPYSTEVLEGFCICKSKVVFARGVSSAVGRLAAAFTHRSASDVDTSRAGAGSDKPFPSWRYPQRAKQADDYVPPQISSRVQQSSGTAFPGLADVLVPHGGPSRDREKTASFGLDHTFPGLGPVSDGLAEARKQDRIRSRSVSIESAPSLADCEWLSPTTAKCQTFADAEMSPEFGVEESTVSIGKCAEAVTRPNPTRLGQEFGDSQSDVASVATVDNTKCLDEVSDPDESGRAGGKASADTWPVAQVADAAISQHSLVRSPTPRGPDTAEITSDSRVHHSQVAFADEFMVGNLMADDRLNMVCSADEMALLAAEGLLPHSGPSLDAVAVRSSANDRGSCPSESVSWKELGIGEVSSMEAKENRSQKKLSGDAPRFSNDSQMDAPSPVMKPVVPMCISPRLAYSSQAVKPGFLLAGGPLLDKTASMKDEDDGFVKGGSFCDSEPFAEPPSQSPTEQTLSPRVVIEVAPGAPAVPRAAASSVPLPEFRSGDRIRGTHNGAQGNVVGFDGDGHPLVRWDASGIVTGCHPDMVMPYRSNKLESPRRVPIKRMTSVAVLPTWTNESECPRCHTLDLNEAQKAEREFLPRSSTVTDVLPRKNREVVIRASDDVRQTPTGDRRFRGSSTLGVLTEQPESPRSRTPVPRQAFAATMAAATEHSFAAPAPPPDFNGWRPTTASLPRCTNSLDPRGQFAPGPHREPLGGRHAVDGQAPVFDVLGTAAAKPGLQRGPLGQGRATGPVYRSIPGPPGCPSPPVLRSGWTLAPQVALQAPRPAMPFSARGHW